MDWTESEYSAETAMRFARSGAQIRIVAAGDACEVCQAMARRVYLPSDAPRLPIRGCRHESCRCSFVAVDPETQRTVPELVQWSARAIKQGQADLARRVLRRAVALDERYELGWLWLSAVVDDETKIVCLEKVLTLNPRNERAAAGLEALRRRAETPTVDKTPALTPPESAPPMERAMPPAPASPELIELREERQVILDQWQQFVQVAINMDAQMLLAQGRAFLIKLDKLDQNALSLLARDERTDELWLQWQEKQDMTAALAEMLQVYQAQREPGVREMEDALGSLIRQLRDRQDALRKQISGVLNRSPFSAGP